MLILLVGIQTNQITPRVKYVAQRELEYVYKEVYANSVVDIENVQFSSSAEQAVLALYAERPITGLTVNMQVTNVPKRFSLFLKAPQINLKYSKIQITVKQTPENPQTSGKIFAGLAMSCNTLNVLYSEISMVCNASAHSSALVQYAKHDAEIVATKIDSVFQAFHASSMFEYFGGAKLSIVNSSVLTVLDLRRNNGEAIYAGSLAAVAKSAAAIDINASMISGYVTVEGELKDGDAVSTLVGQADSKVTINLKDSQYCMQGNYKQPTCGKENGCTVNSISEHVPDPIKYVSFKSFAGSQGDWRYGFSDINGNNTDFELTEEVSNSVQSGRASLFYQQTKFFNIKISAFGIDINATSMSMMVLTNEETIYKCINIRMSNTALGSSSTIYMLQESATTSNIQQVVINCDLKKTSQGRYVGLSNEVPRGGTITVLDSRINGTFYSRQREATLGVNTVTNGTVNFTNLFVNISDIQHGGGSSVLMNVVQDQSNVVFDNASFSVNNTDTTKHIGGNRQNFGGFCLVVRNSTFRVNNSEIKSKLYFENYFTETGIMVGRSEASQVTLENIVAHGGLYMVGNVQQVGLIGVIVNSQLFNISNMTVGTGNEPFELNVTGATRNSSYHIGAIGRVLDVNLIFSNASLNYTIDSNSTEIVGFIGYLESSPGGEGYNDQTNQNVWTYPGSFNGKENFYFTVKNISINSTIYAYHHVGVLVGDVYKYQFNKENNTMQNLTVNCSAYGHLKESDFFGTIARIRYSVITIRDTRVTSTFQGYNYSASQKFRSYIGGIAGIGQAYVFLDLDKYTAKFDIHYALGTFGGLLGEVSAWHSNQLYKSEELDWLDYTKYPISQINISNSQISGTVRNSANQTGICVGVIQNASVSLNNVSLSITDTARPIIGIMYQTPRQYFRDRNGNRNNSLYQFISYLRLQQVTTVSGQKCVGNKISDDGAVQITSYIYGSSGVCSMSDRDQDWNGTFGN